MKPRYARATFIQEESLREYTVVILQEFKKINFIVKKWFKMVIKKSDTLSAKFRAEGNKTFQKGDYFNALVLYNKVKRKKTCAGTNFHNLGHLLCGLEGNISTRLC